MKLRTLADAFDPAAFPESRIAIYGPLGRAQTTYRELSELVAVAAAQIEQTGLVHGCPIGLVGPNSVGQLAALLAIIRSGRTAVPLNYRLPLHQLAQIGEAAGLGAVFKEDNSAVFEGIPNLPFPRPRLAPLPFPPNMAEPRDTALLLFTSGSTGTPKGVRLSHASQAASLETFSSLRTGLRQMSTIIAAPMYHMNALTFLSLSLWSGSSFVLMSRFEALEFATAVAAERVNVISGVPGMIMALHALPEVRSLDLSTVRSVNLGSAPLTPNVLDAAKSLFPNARITNGYGTTEIGPGVFGPHPQGKPRPGLSVGYPASNVKVRLVDGRDENEGVLEVSGPTLMEGYHSGADFAAARLKDGWYRTGDIMRRDESGFFYFVGREDDMFVCNGENIYPAEVEQVIQAMDGVAHAVVVPVDDTRRGQIPVAFVVPAVGAALDEDQVRRHALENAAAHLHPRHVFIVDSLPLTPVGKVDHRRLVNEATVSLASRKNPA